ncbi:hypothetical protein [Pseudomonas sp. RIT-PI-S]|uniref:hypothetical protein n=1 Tax=Pseudomonas sp. RIT-PI-S TaxID=3035295 RepID=UPI0021D85516|nr:hypothetical protein [Pseudomonas sp. RIT-PI-S]
MNYLIKAFGTFNPQADEDAAIKFIINIILMDHRTKTLAELISDENRIGGMEGDPGWLLERRDLVDIGDEKKYPRWPADACFYAVVDEQGYELGHPEIYMTREIFMNYVRTSMAAYIEVNPGMAQDPSVKKLCKEA